MNLLWVAVIATFVMAEKMLAKGEKLLGQIGGVAMVAVGLVLVARFF